MTMQELLQKKQKSRPKKKHKASLSVTKSAVQWLPKLAARKLTHVYNHKKRLGKRVKIQNYDLYKSLCYRVVVSECSQIVLPQVQTFLKGLKKFTRRLLSSLNRSSILVSYYNLFWNVQTRRAKGSRMGSGKSPAVAHSASMHPGTVLFAVSEIRGNSASGAFTLLKQNKKKISCSTKIKYAVFAF